MKRITKRDVCLCIALISIILLLLCEIFGFSSLFDGADQNTRTSLDMIATRLLGGIAFLSMLINLGYRVLDPIGNRFWGSILFAIPAFVIAVNNFPFSCVIGGEAYLSAPWWAVALLLLECMCVGFFEECAFRGVVFLGILKKNPHSRVWAFVSIAASSVVFGLVHLINLIESSPLAVLMQIGYSALIGAMCAVVLMKSANIWLCVIIHGLFNFAGAVIPRCGFGEIWDPFTVALTVVVSVAVALYFVIYFIKGKFEAVSDIYARK